MRFSIKISRCLPTRNAHPLSSTARNASLTVLHAPYLQKINIYTHNINIITSTMKHWQFVRFAWRGFFLYCLNVASCCRHLLILTFSFTIISLSRRNWPSFWRCYFLIGILERKKITFMMSVFFLTTPNFRYVNLEARQKQARIQGCPLICELFKATSSFLLL